MWKFCVGMFPDIRDVLPVYKLKYITTELSFFLKTIQFTARSPKFSL